MKKGFIKSETTERIDKETGLLIKTDTVKFHEIKLEESDKFFMVYYNMLKSFYQIKYIKDVMLLIKFAELADYNTGKVDLSTMLRNEICEELDIKNSNLSTMIKRLVELNLMHGSKGSYILNEDVFWKGDKKTRMEILKNKGLELNIKFVI